VPRLNSSTGKDLKFWKEIDNLRWTWMRNQMGQEAIWIYRRRSDLVISFSYYKTKTLSLRASDGELPKVMTRTNM
jgi:hypothetical protein